MRGIFTSRTRSFVFVALIAGLAMIGGVALAAALISDTGTHNVEVADRTGFEEAILDNAIVQYIGDSHETFGSAGSGVFDAFVRLQADETESGYNTDNKNPEFDTKKGGFTNSILLSEIPTIDVGGAPYWEFFADINDSDNTPLISLNEFELWLTDDPELIGYPFGPPTVHLYDFSGEILINDVNQGSGRGDLRYLVEQGTFDLGDCTYGNPACTTNLVLYSEWGTSGAPYGSDGGFEEWKVKRYPILEVTKDVFGSFETYVDWDITKTVTPDQWDLFTGETGTSKYTVSVTKTESDPLNTMAYGTITIAGDDKEDVDAHIADSFAGNPAMITGCSVPQNTDGTYTIESKSTVTCDHTIALNAPIAGENEATATFDVDGTTLRFSGSASLALGDYDETFTGEPLEINVTDTNGESWGPVDADTSWMYERTFACDDDEGNNGNIATITETGDSDIANVLVTCYGLTVTKDADTEFTRSFDWMIDKEADETSIELAYGESATITYTVEVDLVDPDGTDSDWKASGKIYIANSHPDRAAVLTGVSDIISPDISATVDCPSLTVPKGGTLTCEYSADLPDGTDRTNTATATQQLYDFDYLGAAIADGTTTYSGTANVVFGDPKYLVDEEITVSDSYAGFLGTVSYDDTLPKTFTYARTVSAPPLECGDHQIDNTATYTVVDDENDTGETGSDSWTVYITVICGDSRLTPTNTECEDFAFERDLAKNNLEYLYYQGEGTVFNVTPGAMFYWIEVEHGGGALEVDVTQTTDFSRELSALDVKFYDSGCTRILDVEFELNGGDPTLTADLPAGTYYMQVRYDPKSLEGADINVSTATFTFGATINGAGGVIPDSLMLVPK